jgi:hypothetical protein
MDKKLLFSPQTICTIYHCFLISTNYQMWCASILGPLFFIFYINDLPNVSDIIETILFPDADDTCLFYSHSNIQQLNDILNNELSKFDCWRRTNSMLI